MDHSPNGTSTVTAGPTDAAPQQRTQEGSARRPGLALYRDAFYWFVALLVLLVVGFWETYFSQLGSGSLDAAHHGHGIAMLLWVFMLITQSWLIRSGRNTHHRMLGRTSLVLAPAVVASGIWVNVRMLQGAQPPLPSRWLSAYWFGFFLVIMFAICYVLAFVHRRKVQLHARYMTATALVFITPGLGRAWYNYVAPITGIEPSSLLISAVPLMIALRLLYVDHRRKRNLTPWLVFSAIWIAGLLLQRVLPLVPAWHDFAAWSARIQG